ncbi:MAG: hypothetical protein KDE35_14620 [Geminicoccaceae bacterium]|nr:hypothetical protein [Geminicoccaceae bacterium]
MAGLSNIASVGLDLALSQQAQRNEDKRLKDERDTRIAALADQTARIERAERDALRRRVAALRARAGAGGTGATGGSIDAVVRGLERDTTDEIGGARRRAAAGIDEIRARASENRRRNLLDFTSSISGLVSGGGSRRSLLG